MRVLTAAGLALLLWGCQGAEQELKQGVWRGVLRLQDQELAFNFAVRRDSAGSYDAFIKNGGENLLLDEVYFRDDSLVMRLHIFDAELKAAVAGDSLRGFYIKNYEKNYRIPFVAAYNQDFRFTPWNEEPHNDFSGTYRVTFKDGERSIPAVGVFQHKAGNIIEGTFMLPAGDYRFLEGNVEGNQMILSTFDGNHAYLFKATKTSDSTLAGEFWSGKTLHRQWTATLDAQASLTDPDSLTVMREGYTTIDVSFPDLQGRMVNPTDEKYRNKVVILQLFGTWCPNCMDETRFLVDWYNRNNHRDVAIIGLAYETSDDFDYARDRVARMAQRLGVEYDLVIAGTRDKESASKSLPMLNGVNAFPTTIFIGRDGLVKKIHTGFTGPGTGIYYEQYKQEFDEYVNELLSENVASRR
jgi:thiol-disulfide isomerase/thioredoxin